MLIFSYEIVAPDPKIHHPPTPNYLFDFSPTGAHQFAYLSSNYPLYYHPTIYM